MSQPGCAASSARPASDRASATKTGAPVRRAISSGSSPTSEALLDAVTARQPRLTRPYPRETTPGRQPAPCKCRTTAIVTGVLPAPPATTLPTTSTGTGKRTGRIQPRR